MERCAFCSFSLSAPLEQARQAFVAHECARPRPTRTSASLVGRSWTYAVLAQPASNAAADEWAEDD
jgi:hypothetical protein